MSVRGQLNWSINVLLYSDSAISQKPTVKQLTLAIFLRFEVSSREMPVNSIYKEKQLEALKLLSQE